MDEDELLYREMNPEDGFYMGDEEYEEVEYEDGCNHERGGSYAPRQRGSKYRSDYAEGYAEGYYDGFQDMAEDYDSEGVYDDEEAELD